MRDVTVRLRLDISDYRAKAAAATAQTRSFMKELEGSAEKRQALNEIGGTFGKIGLAAGAAGIIAVRSFANFDQAVSAIEATGDDAASSIGQLRDLAVDLGASTVFSATEAAGAIEAMAKAGVSAQDILGGGLKGALDLASAGSLSVGEAAEIAATAMNQFGLAGADVPHIADVLAAAAGKAMGDVTDMAAAFKFVGPVANQMGVSLEETAGTIAYLAQQGVLGEQAGTSLRGILTSLTSPSKLAAKEMENLGISVYDAQGNFVGFDGVAGQLQERLGGLGNAERDAALGRIFGNEQITTARLLYQGGAEDVQKWTKAVDDQGFAAETAATKLDNLKGDLEQLSGAFETALIGTGEGANGPLRESVQLLTGLLDAYNALPGPIKTGALAALGLTAAIGGTAFVASRAVTGYGNLRSNLSTLGIQMGVVTKKSLAMKAGIGAAGLGLTALSGPAHKADDDLGDLVDIASAMAIGFAVGGPWGAAIGGGATLLSQLGSGGADAAAQLDRVTAALDQQTGAITDSNVKVAAKTLQDSGAANALKDMGISLATATKAATGNAAALDLVKARLAELKSGGPFSVDDYAASGNALESIIRLSGDAQQGGKNVRELAAASGDASKGIAGVGTAAATSTEEVKSFGDALSGLLDPLLGQEDASNAWKDSLAGLTEELRKTGGNLDDNTMKGRANQNAIRDRVKALKDSVAADEEAGVGQDELGAKLERGAKKILAAGTAAGISKGEMRDYLAVLGLTPDQIDTLIDVKGGPESLDEVRGVHQSIRALDKDAAKPTVTVGGLNGALSGLARIGQSLDVLNGKRSTSYIAVNKTVYDHGTQKDADGGFHVNGTRAFAAGGFDEFGRPVPREPQMRQGSQGQVLWGEAETGWEAYISGKPGKESRNRMIWLEAGRRLGMVDGADAFADGGLVDASSARELTQMRIRIRDLQRSLVEREKYGKKPKKGKQKTRLALRGLDRVEATQELAEARAEYAEQVTVRRRIPRGTSIDAYNASLETSRKASEASASFANDFDSGSFSSPASLERALAQKVAESADFTLALSDLKRAGAAPWLLEQLIKAGPSKASIRTARALVSDGDRLKRLNALAGQLQTTSSTYGALTADPRFLQAGAASLLSSAQSRVLQVSVSTTDYSTQARETSRVLTHDLQAMATGAGV